MLFWGLVGILDGWVFGKIRLGDLEDGETLIVLPRGYKEAMADVKEAIQVWGEREEGRVDLRPVQEALERARSEGRILVPALPNYVAWFELDGLLMRQGQPTLFPPELREVFWHQRATATSLRRLIADLRGRGDDAPNLFQPSDPQPVEDDDTEAAVDTTENVAAA